MRRRQLALLSAAARLVRRADRAEWLAEWRAELCYVPPESRTAFCLGAFWDALWVRRHSPVPAATYLQSPWQCLGFLAVLAAGSLFFAFRLPQARELLFPPVYGDGAHLATISGVPLEDFQALAAGSLDFAFYRIVWGRLSIPNGRDLAVALATPNLFDLLAIPLPSQPGSLILTRHAWRVYFGGDPRAIGRRVTIAGHTAEVAAVVSDHAWRLPGEADAWLLVNEQSLAQVGRGHVLGAFSPGPVSIHDPEGGLRHLRPVPVPEPQPLLAFLLVILITGALLPSLTTMSLGEYPPSEVRRWIFLGAKFALVLPIILFGSLDLFSLIAAGLEPHAMVVGTVAGFRWVLMDQRRRCPICLRVLTHPASIGQASRTFLDWYGTELLCMRGHGLLHVPEIRGTYATQRWLPLDSSWSSLFS